MKPSLAILTLMGSAGGCRSDDVVPLSQAEIDSRVEAFEQQACHILELMCLNCILVDAGLVVTMRKPLDLLAEGLDLKDIRGDKTAIERSDSVGGFS